MHEKFVASTIGVVHLIHMLPFQEDSDIDLHAKQFCPSLSYEDI